MNMKKTAVILLVVAMALTIAACNDNTGRSSAASSLPEGTPNTSDGGTELSEPPAASTPPETSTPNEPAGDAQTFSDGTVSLDISFDREEYTLNELIGLSVTVTNVSDKPIMFVKGSGSNNVPEAMVINFGTFVNTYTPQVMTMDYQLETLQSGESKTYQLPYAPYSPVGEPEPGAGYNATIDFFQNENYTPAAIGETGGEILFSYIVPDANTPAMPDFTGEDVQTLQAVFQTNIVE